MESPYPDTSPTPLAAPPEPSLGDFEPLRRAERILVRACLAGDIAKVGFQRPIGPQPGLTIRGELLAFLARGGSRAMPVKGRRIQLVGAWIEGRVDLGGAEVPASLWLFRCVFDQPLLLDGAWVGGSVSLPDCRLRGLLAERCRISGDLALNAGCKVGGELRLARAVIDGDLKLDRLRLAGDEAELPGRRSLVADLVHVSGDVVLARGFEARGEVRFVGARIAGDFAATDAHLAGSLDNHGARRAALNLDRAEVSGDVRLGAGFAAAGGVRLKRARIAGDLDGAEAAFDVLGDAGWDDGSVLSVERARIGGTLRLQKLRAPLSGASLEGAEAAVLRDDRDTWGERNVLDGFRYRGLAADAPTDAATRLAWLGSQPPEHLGSDHRAQPWRQIIRVLRRAGRRDSAARIAERREHHLHLIGRIGAALPAPLRAVVRGTHAVFGAVAGYGYRPARLFGWLAAVWIGCTIAYAAADQAGLIRPVADGAGAFQPALYSLDLLVPALDLSQQGRFDAPGPAAWRACLDDPASRPCEVAALRTLSWIEALCGWLGVLLLAASLMGLADRERRG